MFTGLIEEIGTVTLVRTHGGMADLTIAANSILEDMSIGDSIAIAGVCQTVTAFNARSFKVQAVAETMRRTTFGTLARGTRVNLERALRVGDRLGGHFVQGHVEGIGTVRAVIPADSGSDFTVQIPSTLARYVVEKGSITIDGISLTVTDADQSSFSVSVIPHTLAATTLGQLRTGDKVNIETDIIAKYIEKLTQTGSEVTMESLNRLGY